MGNPETGASSSEMDFFIKYAGDDAINPHPRSVLDYPQMPLEGRPGKDKAHRAFLRAVMEHSVYVDPKELLNNPLGLKEANGDKSGVPELLVE